MDAPIIDIINGFNSLPHCFTLQSCYGHFVYNGQKDAFNLASLPPKVPGGKVTYRIAYIAFCIENNGAGKKLFKELARISALDPENIQFCCAKWFWERQVNSYVLQVEPDRFKHKDTAVLAFEEALHIEKTRNEFFKGLHKLLDRKAGGS